MATRLKRLSFWNGIKSGRRYEHTLASNLDLTSSPRPNLNNSYGLKRCRVKKIFLLIGAFDGCRITLLQLVQELTYPYENPGLWLHARKRFKSANTSSLSFVRACHFLLTPSHVFRESRFLPSIVAKEACMHVHL